MLDWWKWEMGGRPFITPPKKKSVEEMNMDALRQGGVEEIQGLMRSLKDPLLRTVTELLQLGQTPERWGRVGGGGVRHVWDERAGSAGEGKKDAERRTTAHG